MDAARQQREAERLERKQQRRALLRRSVGALQDLQKLEALAAFLDAQASVDQLSEPVDWLRHELGIMADEVRASLSREALLAEILQKGLYSEYDI
jgi:hypothetical protein